MLFLFKLILLAIIQGIGEILPISSSGHLIMVSDLLDLENENLSIEILLHLASLIALTIYYFKNIKKMVIGVIKYIFLKDKSYYKEWGYFTTLIIATLPCAILGYFINDYMIYLSSYVGLFLVINGIIILIFNDKRGEREIEDLTIRDKLRFGIYQCLGLIPGISRSGIVLSAGKRNKLNSEDNFNLTFYMLFPLVIGSLLLNLGDFNFDTQMIIPYIITFIITFGLTYFSMFILHDLITKNRSKIFGYYCLGVGIIYSVINLL